MFAANLARLRSAPALLPIPPIYPAILVAIPLANLLSIPLAPARAAERSYRLPAASESLREPILWGAECVLPDGSGLAFGGHEQAAEDGCQHTRVREAGAWRPIIEELRDRNPLRELAAKAWDVRSRVKSFAAWARRLYFRGLPPEEEQKKLAGAQGLPLIEELERNLTSLAAELSRSRDLGEYEAGQASFAIGRLKGATAQIQKARGSFAGAPGRLVPEAVQALWEAQIELEKASEALGAEPPPRAYSPIAFDEESKLFVLFGGDHLDYLTNDTWVFDRAKRRWFQRHPTGAPQPRALHVLRATGRGRVVLSGGYTYASSTDYCGGQYRDVGDGEWAYDVAADAWTAVAGGKRAPAESRTYRTGPFHPSFFLEGPGPDAAAFESRLRSLPANVWVLPRPVLRPSLNRDWGTAVLDTDRDAILFWSGGHSAHGGSDVLHYHLSTNRWELPFPVEFPLGQLYSNTSYPGGFNFNLRPWVTGHTYQSYGYDPVAGRLLFTGHEHHCYAYDPEAADWRGRFPKPDGMVYESCFYTLTVNATPKGLVCWTERGRIFRYETDADAKSAGGIWNEIRFTGKLPGASVDFSTMAYDSRRDRELFFRTGYGERYDGRVWSLDLKALTASELSAPNASAVATGSGFGIDRACYVPDADLVLFGTLLQPAAGGLSGAVGSSPGDPRRNGDDVLRLTPAFDCTVDRWVTLRLAYETAGDDKAPQTPRGHSSGIVYDPRRRLVWGVDAGCNAYILRLDRATADVREMQ